MAGERRCVAERLQIAEKLELPGGAGCAQSCRRLKDCYTQ